jgi:hypothetical protein
MRATRLRKGDDKGLTEDAAVLPGYMAKAIRNESQKVGQVTSYKIASTLVVRCLSKKFSRTTIGFHERRKVASNKLRKRIKFQKAPSQNERKQADLHVTRVGIQGFKAPRDTNKSPAGSRNKATNTRARASHFVS